LPRWILARVRSRAENSKSHDLNELYNILGKEIPYDADRCCDTKAAAPDDIPIVHTLDILHDTVDRLLVELHEQQNESALVDKAVG
jgi:hypothetical protein